jgi:putative hydrolases of HD superfamily
MERIDKQIDFLLEIDRLKSIYRRNYISDGTKRENDAEHSWYFAMAALLLSEYSNIKIDINKVIRMALIHDIVEIDAGDTFIYDEIAKKGQKEREAKAAERIFGILPDDQKAYYLDLWGEFEDNVTDESRFARSIDRVVAILLNYKSNGKAWKENKIVYSQVYEVNKRIAEGSVKIWTLIEDIIKRAAAEGKLDKV